MAVTRKTEMKPDSSGRYRPRIGYIEPDSNAQKRFNLGTSKVIAEERRARIQSIYDHQCEHLGIQWWDEIVVRVAESVSKGEPLKWTVWSNKLNGAGEYEAAMEAAVLTDLSTTYGVPIIWDDDEQINNGKGALRKMIVGEVQEAVGDILSRHRSEWGQLAEQVQLPGDPTKTDFRPLSEAIDEYIKHIHATGRKTEDGLDAKSTAIRINLIRQIRERDGDITISELNLKKIDTIVSYWKNRPPSIHNDRCSFDHAEATIKQFFRFMRWLDTSSFRWDIPKGLDSIDRKVVVFPSERQQSAVTIETYSPEQLAEIVKECNDHQKAIVLLSLNCSFSHGEVGRVSWDNFLFDAPHPHAEILEIEASENDSWLFFNRPKTGVYGEWWLWPETVQLLKLARERANQLGSDLLCCNTRGNPMYNEKSKSPQSTINSFWNAHPSESKKSRKVGAVTRVERRIEGFPRFPFKSLRKTVSGVIRRKFGGEVASLMLCHGEATNDELLDIYADRPFGRLHEALQVVRSHYKPIFDVL